MKLENVNFQLVPADLSKEYMDKFQITYNDYLYIFKDGKRISNTLYRIGGIFQCVNGYVNLIKYVEDKYSEDIIKSSMEFHIIDQYRSLIHQ